MQTTQWVTVQECVGLSGFPVSPANIRRKLENLVCGRNELFRKRQGSKAVEYRLDALPVEARAELLLKQGAVETSQGIVELARPASAALDSERRALWQRWDAASDSQRQLAERWHPVVMLADELIASGITAKTAFQTAASRYDVSAASLRDKYYRVQKYAKQDWVALLIDRRGGAKHESKQVGFDEDAWQFLLTGLIVGAPDGIIITVFAATPKPVDMEILISPNTEAMQSAVKSALVSLFYNESEPGGSLAQSHIIRAIAKVSGLSDFKLRAPADDVLYSEATELLTVGEITWL